MALKLIEGFDHLSNSTKLQTKAWTLTLLPISSPAPAAGMVTGRLAGKAFQISATNPNGPNGGTSTLVKILPSSHVTQTLGFAFQITRLPISVGATVIAVIRAGATNTVTIGINSSGLIVLRNSSGTILATGTTVITLNSWYYIEVKAFANGASGTVACQLNGISEIASTTANIGSTAMDTISLQATPVDFPISQTWSVTWDDVYVADGSGSANTTFLGDVRVNTIYPSADGAHSDFTPDTGTAHFSRVNEATGTYPDDDTSYVFDNTVGHRDSYAFDNLASLSGSIFGIQTNLYARKDDAALRQICAVARPTTTNSDGASATLGTTYTTFTEIRETNPDTSVAWTVSDVNASEFGIKVVT